MNRGLASFILLYFVQGITAQIDLSTCGSSKMCLSKPDGCTVGLNCAYAMSYQADDTKVYLELYGQVQAPTAVYVAVGFSSDRIMGRDAVIVCSDPDANGTFRGYLAYNPGKSNRPVTLSPELDNTMIKTVKTSYSNGYLYCLIERTIAPVDGVNSEQVFDLSAPYYVIMASGVMTEQQTRIHNLDPTSSLFPYVSPEQVNLLQMRSKRAESDILAGYQLSLQPTPGHAANSSGMVGSPMQQFPQQQQQFPPQNQQQQQQQQQFQPGLQAQNDQTKRNADLLKAHATLMLIAWTFFLPIGVFFGYFFKRHWPNTYILRGNIWFQVHRTFNMIGIACTIAAFVCIFVRENWEWVGPSPTKTTDENQAWGSVHAMLGILACVVAWAQPLNAVFRCHPGSTFRFIFSVIHGFFGTGALLMAFAAIMIAVCHFTAVFTNADAAKGIYIAFIAVVGVCFILLTLLSLLHWWKARRNVAAVDMELVQVNGKRHVTLAPDTIRTQRIMNVIFLFFIFVATAATVAIAVLIGRTGL